jgi:hypothetical protein
MGRRTVLRAGVKRVGIPKTPMVTAFPLFWHGGNSRDRGKAKTVFTQKARGRNIFSAEGLRLAKGIAPRIATD